MGNGLLRAARAHARALAATPTYHESVRLSPFAVFSFTNSTISWSDSGSLLISIAVFVSSIEGLYSALDNDCFFCVFSCHNEALNDERVCPCPFSWQGSSSKWFFNVQGVSLSTFSQCVFSASRHTHADVCYFLSQLMLCKIPLRKIQTPLQSGGFSGVCQPRLADLRASQTSCKYCYSSCFHSYCYFRCFVSYSCRHFYSCSCHHVFSYLLMTMARLMTPSQLGTESHRSHVQRCTAFESKSDSMAEPTAARAHARAQMFNHVNCQQMSMCVST